MEHKFQIISNGNRQVPQLSLVGVFTGSAVRSLVEAIQKEAAAERIIVNTNGLTKVMGGAVKSYAEAFSETGRLPSKVFFCGKHASEIAPQGAMVLY